MSKSAFIIFCLAICLTAQAQNVKIDSLRRLLVSSSQVDTQRVNLLNALSKAHIRVSPDTVKKMGEEALRLAKKLGFEKGIGQALNNIGISYYFKGNYPKAINYYQESLAVFQAIKNLKGISSIYNNLGIIQRRQGNYPNALRYYQKALLIQEKLKDIRLMAYSHNNIGSIALYRQNYDKALESYKKSLELKKKLASSKGLATAYNNIGRVYGEKDMLDSALVYYQKALKIYKKFNLRIAPYYSNVGDTYLKLNKPDSALVYQQRAIEEAVKSKAPRYHTLALLGLAKIYYAQAKYRKAINKALECWDIAKGMTSLVIMRDAQEILYKNYQQLQNYQAAFEAHLKYSQLQDSVLNTSRVKELTMLEMNYSFEKKQAVVKAKQKAKEERLKIENKKKLSQQRLYLFIVLGVLVIVVLFSGFVFRSRQVQKKLNVQLTEQKNDLQQKKNELVVLNEELHQSRDEVITQRDYIERQHKNLSLNKDRIDSSIRAAQTIQQAVLPFANEMKQVFADYFVIYRPKDVVSGDFYWLKRLPNQTIVVVADCTGHGVPGAFMSLIGVNLLDKIIFQDNITQPADILNRLHLLMNIALRQQDSEQRSGGMDAAVFSLAPAPNNEIAITFSGARNPLYYKAPDMPEIQILLGTRKSIGGYHNDKNAFIAHHITLPKGSMLYAGSDGFQDQNNANRKKFGSKQLVKLLNLVVDKPLPKQKALLESELDDHMQDTSQRDDIVWMGIKL